MKDLLISILRNQNSDMQEFRRASELLATTLAAESDQFIRKNTLEIDTPLAKTEGVILPKQVLLVPILRAGLTFLPPFLKFYPDALVGFIGARRDETTAIPHLYYVKIPSFSPENPILLLDPMLATGGSSCLAIDTLLEKGACESQITLVSAIAAPEGIDHLKAQHPGVHTIIAQVDQHLDPHKFIYPGLGDFGDRFFGTLDIT